MNQVAVIHRAFEAPEDHNTVAIVNTELEGMEALEYAYRWTNNIDGSWSRKEKTFKHEGKTYPNGDYNEAVTVMAALHEKDGVTYGLRSTSVGDWMLLGNKRYEVASMGFKEVNLEPKEGK